MKKPVQKNFLGLKRIDHVHFYVRDLDKATDRYIRGFNFHTVAGANNACIGLPYSVPCHSVVLNQNKIVFVFTQPRLNDSEITEHIKKHGDGVKDVAFLVEDAKVALEEAERRGARVVVPLQREMDARGVFSWGSIAAYGDVVHSFIERKKYKEGFAPGYRPEWDSRDWSSDISLLMIDHVVANVYSMKEWVEFYERVFGLVQTQHFDIKTPRSALMSMVMEDRDVYIKLPINEPVNEPGGGKSQIQEYLDDYNGPGVQHIALLTNNIIPTIKEMRHRGVEFLQTPETYYDSLAKRVGEIDEGVDDLKKTSILVDREAEDAYLLQIFAKNHPFFEEVIQRKGNSYGFGHGNFQALFEAIEREQIKRGTLKHK